MASAARHLIPLELELGGKDPMLVFDDVDIDRTVNGALWGAFAGAGRPARPSNASTFRKASMTGLWPR